MNPADLIVIDYPFVFCPSVMMEAKGIVEGKAIGTADELDKQTMQALTNPLTGEELRRRRKTGGTVGRRKFKAAQEEARNEVLDAVWAFDQDSIDAKELKSRVKAAMRTAWRRVYLAGLHAGGMPARSKGRADLDMPLEPHDEAWLKTAMTHETRYLNKFISAVVSGTGQMPLDRRANMYVDALESFYNSARVIALPTDILIYWRGPNDKKTCDSCRYLFAHNPYTKMTLPTTPRSGMTMCLTNCRDWLFIRKVPTTEVAKVTNTSKSASAHIRALRKIKRNRVWTEPRRAKVAGPASPPALPKPKKRKHPKGLPKPQPPTPTPKPVVVNKRKRRKAAAPKIGWWMTRAKDVK